METDGVGTVGRSRAEHALLRTGQVVARVHNEHVTSGAIEPRQQPDGLTGVEVLEALDELGREDQLRLWRALIALPRRGSEVDEPGANPPDWMHVILAPGHRDILPEAAGRIWAGFVSGREWSRKPQQIPPRSVFRTQQLPGSCSCTAGASTAPAGKPSTPTPRSPGGPARSAAPSPNLRGGQAQLVPRRHRRPHDPPTSTTRHGRTRRRDRGRNGRLPLRLPLPTDRRRRPHRAGRRVRGRRIPRNRLAYLINGHRPEIRQRHRAARRTRRRIRTIGDSCAHRVVLLQLFGQIGETGVR
jgi:hypothetical protein